MRSISFTFRYHWNMTDGFRSKERPQSYQMFWMKIAQVSGKWLEQTQLQIQETFFDICRTFYLHPDQFCRQIRLKSVWSKSYQSCQLQQVWNGRKEYACCAWNNLTQRSILLVGNFGWYNCIDEYWIKVNELRCWSHKNEQYTCGSHFFGTW